MGLLVEMPLLKLLNQSTKNYCKILNTVFLTIVIVLWLFFWSGYRFYGKNTGVGEAVKNSTYRALVNICQSDIVKPYEC